jgi:UDP-N-acetylmuramate-alanine ligase
MNDKKVKYLQEIRKHVRYVQIFLHKFSEDLTNRGIVHDNSKFSEPELSGFSENIDNIPNLVYESDEYKKRWLEMKPIIDVHHKSNRHHPEYWMNGVEDMSLSDIVEMLVDWKASSMRYKDGSLAKSVDINCEKYGISPQLKKILLNTIRDHFPEDDV